MISKLLTLLALLAILGNLLLLKMSMSGISFDVTGGDAEMEDLLLSSAADYSSSEKAEELFVTESPSVHDPSKPIAILSLDGEKSSIIMMRFLCIALFIIATKASTTSFPSSGVSEETFTTVGTTQEPRDPLDEEVQVEARDEIRNILPVSDILKESMIKGALVAASVVLGRYLVLNPSANPFASILSELAKKKSIDVEIWALKELILQLLVLVRNLPFVPKFEKVSLKNAGSKLVAAIVLALLFAPTLQSVNTISMGPRLELYQGIYDSVFTRGDVGVEEMAIADEEVMPVAQEVMPIAQENNHQDVVVI